MRSIVLGAGLFGLLLSVNGCADILGIEPWKDPAQAGDGNDDGEGGKEDVTSSAAGGGGVGGGDTCSDGVQDGDEADVDCGGSTCPACPDGAACMTDEDCASDFCSPRQLCAYDDGRCEMESEAGPTCGDCLKNGDETDADCGGATCLACRPGKTCLQDADCLGGACLNNVCDAGAAGTRCYANADCKGGQCLGADLTGGVCQ
ncbi:hypothetical protein [Polyangium spumosum]|uniref:Tryptophan synthase alpha chain n=1 Tax=Polyangium spumosum TaxID=889282 RepID=A0A6N7PH41_9BACT|nr:hypothetical protein [Polyangium spumosum]MRG91383.1 hypothetical protein [Polyangium spumosum]